MISLKIYGRLTADPETVTPQSGGDPFVRFTLASNRSRRKGEDKGAEFVQVSVFGKQGDVIKQYFHKGSRIVADVRDLETHPTVGNNGTPYANLHAVLTGFEFVDTANEAAPAQQSAGYQQPVAQAYGKPYAQPQQQTYAQPAQQAYTQQAPQQGLPFQQPAGYGHPAPQGAPFTAPAGNPYGGNR